jgi:L-fucose isomerase-like protein
MYKEVIRIGLMPTKRPFFSMETAKAEYDVIVPIIKAQMPGCVEFIDIEDCCENGMVSLNKDFPAVIEKFKRANLDALFAPFCDFGCEEAVMSVAKEFDLPLLIWSTNDKVSTYEHREKEAQCGVFAATKVLQNYHVKFSYICGCEPDGKEFVEGFEKFVRVASVLKALRNLSVAEIGDRPGAFFSVIHNQLALIQNFNITVRPIGLAAIGALTDQIVEENSQELQDYVADIKSRIDCSACEDDSYPTRVAAGTLAIERLMKQNDCKTAAFDCGGVRNACKIPGSACAIEGELADRGFVTACETDVWGAISALILEAASIGADSPFLADWTYRHPTNPNGELVWHGGPFAYSLADKAKNPEYHKRSFRGRTMYEAHWEMKKGDITMLRMDEMDGEYYIFCGEGHTIDGPATTGTYVWIEVDNWKRWEEHFMFGPYIHHCGGIYGNVKPALREAARYLDMIFDDPSEQGTYSL